MWSTHPQHILRVIDGVSRVVDHLLRVHIRLEIVHRSPLQRIVFSNTFGSLYKHARAVHRKSGHNQLYPIDQRNRPFDTLSVRVVRSILVDVRIFEEQQIAIFTQFRKTYRTVNRQFPVLA